MPKIRAITFDLDDTLYDNMPYIHMAQKQLDAYLASSYPATKQISAKAWSDLRAKLLQEQPELANDMGALRLNVLRRAFESVGMSEQEREKAATDCFTFFYAKRSDFTVEDKVLKTLKKLSKQLPLVAITNGNVDCKKIGISPFFSHEFHANVEQPMKPNRAMFDKASKALNIPSKNILHVGDHLIKDVLGATRAGFQTAWLAVNRPMLIKHEPANVLPCVQLEKISELKQLIAK